METEVGASLCSNNNLVMCGAGRWEDVAHVFRSCGHKERKTELTYLASVTQLEPFCASDGADFVGEGTHRESHCWLVALSFPTTIQHVFAIPEGLKGRV